MGMFSTLLHAGREYQFKTGHDDALGTYQIGDRIDWEPDPYWPGSHVDGVHDALDVAGAGGRTDVWVVIKDSTIIAVEPWDAGGPQELEAKYGITEPDRNLWTEEQWAAREAREAKAKADYEAWKAQHSTGDDVADACRYLIHCKLREGPIIDKTLPVKKAD